MKKFIALSMILLSAGLIYGQQSVDNLLKARALREAGNTDQSISLLNAALNEKKESSLYTERAEDDIVKKDYSGAISDFNEANRINPNSGEFGLSRVYALKGDVSTALYHLELSMKSNFKKAEKEILLDPAFSNLENRQEWRQFWKKEWYSNTEKSISEVEYYVSAGKIEDAKNVLSELKKSYNSDSDIQYPEALINLKEGNYQDAIKAVAALDEANPGNEKYLRLLANAQAGSSDPAGASSTYTRLLSMGVADAELYLSRAECYRKTGETDKALADIKKYIEIYPNNSKALSLAGTVEAKSGDNLQALDYYSRNLKLHPNDPQCYIDRGNSYFMSKSWDMAANDYSMSLDLKPGNSDVWLNLGIALLNKGRTEDACHDFRKSLSLGNKRATEYISRSCIK